MLGDLIPVMTGVAMAGRYLGQKIVAMTWIGDGGTSTGAFHEGLNFAAVQRAPFVLIVENNQWAYSTPVARQVASRGSGRPRRRLRNRQQHRGRQRRARRLRTPRSRCRRCRAGRGPVLIEAKTMRMHGHAQHDPAEYVPKAMLEFWKTRDPIARYEKYLTENKLWDAANKIRNRCAHRPRTRRGSKFAEDSPLPPPEIAEQGVYCDGCHTIEAEWQRPKEEVMPPRPASKPFGKSLTSARSRLRLQPHLRLRRALLQSRSQLLLRLPQPQWTMPESPKKFRCAFPSAAAAKIAPSNSSAATKLRNVRRNATRTPNLTNGGGANHARNHHLEAIRQAMFEEMDRDPAVVLIGEDIGVYGGAFKATEGLLARFGHERVIDTPISESAIVGAAFGMSYLGPASRRRNAVHRFHRLLLQPDHQHGRQIALSLGRARAHGAARPLRRRRSRRAVPLRESGNVFRAHARTESRLSRRPPTTPRACSNPRSATTTRCFSSSTNFSIAASRKKCRRAITLCRSARLSSAAKAAISPSSATRRWCTLALEAAATLAKEGIEAEVIDLRTLLPLDRETILESVKKTNQAARRPRRHAHRRHRRRNCRHRLRGGLRGSRRPHLAASLRWTRRCPTRRPLRNISYPTPKKLSLPLANWQNTSVGERGLAPWEKRRV